MLPAAFELYQNAALRQPLLLLPFVPFWQGERQVESDLLAPLTGEEAEIGEPKLLHACLNISGVFEAATLWCRHD